LVSYPPFFFWRDWGLNLGLCTWALATWATPAVHFALVILGMPWTTILQISASQVARIPGASHRSPASFWFWSVFSWWLWALFHLFIDRLYLFGKMSVWIPSPFLSWVAFLLSFGNCLYPLDSKYILHKRWSANIFSHSVSYLHFSGDVACSMKVLNFG
jgi:hypothetical protein